MSLRTLENVKTQFVDVSKLIVGKAELIGNGNTGDVKLVFWKDTLSKFLNEEYDTYDLLVMRSSTYNISLYHGLTSRTYLKKSSQS